MSDFYADDKKEKLPDEWKQWVDQQQGTADNLEQSAKDTYFGVTAGSELAEPTELASAADIPAGESNEGMA